jgi:diguanylate cyclase (GGDEF)-like protein/PAS domain S-box-containing protein
MLVILFSSLSLLAGAICLTFGAMVMRKDNHSRLNRVFMLLCLTMAYWGFMEFELRHSVSLEQAKTWSRMNFLWPISVALLIHFVLIFTKQKRLTEHRLTYLVLYGSTATMSVLYLTTHQMVGTPLERYWGWTYDTPDTLIYHLSTLAIVVMALTGAYLAFRFHLKQRDPIKRKQSGLVLIGLAIPIVLGSGADAILPALGIRVPEMTAISFAVGAAGFIGFAIWKYELFGITLAQTAHNILAAISDGLFIVDPAHNVITVNDAALKLLGYDENELVGFHLGKIFGEEEMLQSPGGVRGQSCAVEDVTDLETYLVAKDKHRIPVSLSSSTLRDKPGQVLGKVIVARDVTQRREAEDKIIAKSADLKTANTELLTLNRISTEMSRTIELNDLLHSALDTITGSKLFDIQKKGGVFIVEKEKLNLVAFMGHDDAFLQAHENLTLDDCLCGLAARTGEAIISSNAICDDRHTIRYPNMNDHGHVIIPLKTADRVVGVMYLYLRAGAKIGKNGRDLLQNIGNQLAVSIENARLFEKTKELSIHDPLTGLANRNLMNEELDKAIAVSRRTGRPVSVIMLDLDHFKKYNDTYGHTEGDRLLTSVAKLISQEIREVDLAARYGGEEFLVILPDSPTEAAVLVADRIRQAVGSTQYILNGGSQPTQIKVSLGVATYDDYIANTDMLVARADASLYSAKNKGRNRVETWQPLLESV